MKACQLCGVCSWGPVSDRNGLWTALMSFGGPSDGDPSNYYRCDHCQSFAMKSLVDEQPLTSPPTLEPSGFLVSDMVTRIQEALPQPDTRTERLIRAILANPATLLSDDLPENAVPVVQFVRAIEQELDRSAPQNVWRLQKGFAYYGQFADALKRIADSGESDLRAIGPPLDDLNRKLEELGYGASCE